MKKIIIANIAALLLTSAAYAADNLSIDFTTPKTGLTVYGAKTGKDASVAGADQKTIGKSSTGVGVGAKTAATGYSMITQHKSGNKAYGSSHDSTAIYMIDATQGTAVTAPTNIGSTDFVASGSGWTTM
jgi:hypothetical protein